MENEATELLQNLLNQTSANINVQSACQVLAVHGNFVDVMLYTNDDIPDMPLYNVPIRRQETQSAYIFLGIKKGDYGVIRFFDTDTNDYIETGSTDFNGNTLTHDINFREFSLGFVPSPDAFVYPTNSEIEIGLKDGSAKITLNKGSITLKGNVTIDGVLTANSIVAKDGASGTYTSSVTATNGIVTGGA